MKLLGRAQEQPGALTPPGAQVTVDIDRASGIMGHIPGNTHQPLQTTADTLRSLPSLGAQEWRPIGQRNHVRNRDLHTRIPTADPNDGLRHHSSSEGRARLSGMNFAAGLHESDNAPDPPMGYDTTTADPHRRRCFRG